MESALNLTAEQRRANLLAMTDDAMRKPSLVKPGGFWHLAMHFIDIDGKHVATWQLLDSERMAHYSLNLDDGIPQRELAIDSWGEGLRVSLRDEATHHERQRIGAP